MDCKSAVAVVTRLGLATANLVGVAVGADCRRALVDAAAASYGAVSPAVDGALHGGINGITTA